MNENARDSMIYKMKGRGLKTWIKKKKKRKNEIEYKLENIVKRAKCHLFFRFSRSVNGFATGDACESSFGFRLRIQLRRK